MRCIRIIFWFIVVTAVLLFSALFIALAVGGMEDMEDMAMNTGFSTERMSEEAVNTVLESINLSMLTDEPPRRPIKCFAVNEEGTIAVGSSRDNNRTVCIYNSDGVFQYGYSFENYGSFGIELDKNVLNIYLVRSDIAISVNSAGEIEDVLKISNTSENNTYWNQHVFSRRRKVGDAEYVIKNDTGILNAFDSSYSQLVVIDKNGEERMIYDVSADKIANMIVAVVVGAIIFGLTAVVLADRSSSKSAASEPLNSIPEDIAFWEQRRNNKRNGGI